MYCRKCKYDLTGLEQNRCPECGTEFDPDVPDTYLDSTLPASVRTPTARRFTFVTGLGMTFLGLLILVTSVASFFVATPDISLFGAPVETTEQRLVSVFISIIVLAIGGLLLWKSMLRRNES